MSDFKDEYNALKRMLERERKARKAAEKTLELKSAELYHKSEALKIVNLGLEDMVRQRTAELQRSEARYRLIVESAKDIIFRATPEGVFTYANPTAVKKTGYTIEELTTLHFTDLVVGNHKNRLLELYTNQVQNGEIETYVEFPAKTKSGEIIWLGQNVTFHYSTEGEFEMVTGVARDITESKTLKNRLENLITNLQTGVLLENENREIVLTNGRLIEMFSIPATPEQMIGVDCSNTAEDLKGLFVEEEAFVKLVERFVSEKKLSKGNILHLKDGRVLEQDYIPIFIDDHYRGHLWNYRDVTDELNQLKAVLESEEKYRRIIHNMNLGLIEVDLNDQVVYSNQRFTEMSGYDEFELIGKTASDIFLTEESKKLMAEKAKEREGGKSDAYEIRVVDKFGNYKWWLVSGAPLYDAHGNQTGSIGIHLDISVQKELSEELAIAKAEAEASSMAKELFLANMSHEIRTPMNGIVGLLRQISRANLNEKEREYITNIFSAADHLMNILNDILDMSKIEAGKLEIETIPFSLTETVKKARNILGPKAEEKFIHFKIEVEEGINDYFFGDPHRLSQLWLNLAGNSVKFTQEGEVKISCKLLREDENTQTIRLCVSDTGIGMDQEYIDRIFEKFTQADRSTTRKYGGTGLGMSISKEIISLMGSEMVISSEKDKGTDIYFDLLLTKASKSDLEANEPKDASADAEKLKGAKILLAEDNDMNQLVVQIMFELLGVELDIANNGQEAVDKLKARQDYNLVLMDVQMPVMSGIEATKVIRNELKLDLPIIALTANVIRQDLERCLDAGMNDFLTKPFEEDQMIYKLTKWCGEIELSPSQEKQVEKEAKNAAQPVDVTYTFDKLHKMSNGKQEFVTKIVSMFLQRSQEGINEMKAALEADDLKKLAEVAHRIKPIYEYVGASDIFEMLKVLEKSIRSDVPSDEWMPNYDTILSKHKALWIIIEKEYHKMIQ